MDSEHFDNLSRRLATPRSRREVLGVLGAAVAGLLAGGAASAAPKADKPSKCYGGGSHCTNARQCCSGICTNRQCEPEIAPECVTATDCPGIDTECQMRTCSGGFCGTENTVAETPCSSGVCDGNGQCVECVTGTDCASGVCTNSQCEPEVAPDCATDADCADGEVCQGDVCVTVSECVDCGSCGVCDNGSCGPALAGTVCREAAGPCDIAEVCDGVSLECPADQFVPGGTICRSQQNECDVAEVCSGFSSQCPPDLRKDNGTPCSVGTCQMGGCIGEGGETECGSGYEWTGTTCVDIDECTLGIDNCSEFATCGNTDGSFTCTCEDGFIGNGVICTPA